MSYQFLTNEPSIRRNLTFPWVYWDEGFTSQELDDITNYCESQESGPGTIVGVGDVKEAEKIRVSQTYFQNRNDETAWIFDRFNSILREANDRYYNFDLNGYENFQYTRYYADRQGHYNWHMDTILGHDNIRSENGLKGETRKLSMTLCLNDDYEGGEFQLNHGREIHPETVPAKKGRAIIFPSFMIHRVAPVTKGIRKSIVVWVLGPKFR
jgi:PKHD-type hydroxylase